MNLYDKIVNKEEKISLIGLGYVGLPIAIAFSEKVDIIGFDVNESKVNSYLAGKDVTMEVGDEVVKNTLVQFTCNPEDLKLAKFHIVAVPTPINKDKTPDLTPVIEASKLLAKNLTVGSIVVYESTVYPGVTEDVCIPLLEEYSNLKCGVDFKVGYSPERINPGDKEHRLENITKIVSGMDAESLDIIAKVYELVVHVGVHRASTIKVAEAAKVIENAQRDINIAFMNELSIIFNKLNIDTKEVLEAARTKWNFLPFEPGLVGGHCIGVDPYYLTYKANEVGYQSEIILAGRKLNDNMGKYIVESLIKVLVKQEVVICKSKVGILGLTFKENCPDIRNSKVIDIITELDTYGIIPTIYDPYADAHEVEEEYGLKLSTIDDFSNLDVLIVAVAHNEFIQYTADQINGMFNENNKTKILFDIKGTLPKDDYSSDCFVLWRL